MTDTIDLKGALTRFASPEQVQQIDGEFRRRLQYSPVIAFMGKTGVGKSSTCNRLFGKELFAIDPVDPCTVDPQGRDLTFQAGTVTLVDLPGIAEAGADEKHLASYCKVLSSGILVNGEVKKIDAIVWVLKADDRAHEPDNIALKALWDQLSDAARRRFVFALNQSDKMDPVRGHGGWDDDRNEPGSAQAVNIARRKQSVAKLFGTDPLHIVDYSASEGYNLSSLLDEIVRVLPQDRIPLVVRSAEAAQSRDRQSATMSQRLVKRLEPVRPPSTSGPKDPGSPRKPEPERAPPRPNPTIVSESAKDKANEAAWAVLIEVVKEIAPKIVARVKDWLATEGPKLWKSIWGWFGKGR